MPFLILAAAVVVAAGGALALQATLNAALGRELASGTAAAAVSFGIGFVALMLVTVARGDGGVFARISSVPWPYLLGGVLGAFYVWAVLWSVPILGVVTAFAALILGQLGMAMLIDATGAFGLAVHAVTPLRVVAVCLVGAGLVLSRF